MDSEKIDELAVIAFETYGRNALFGKNHKWEELDPVFQEAWRKTVTSIIKKNSIETPDTEVFCCWTVEAGYKNDSDETISEYDRCYTLSKQDFISKNGVQFFSIKLTSVIEHIRFILMNDAGVSWLTLKWEKLTPK